jgi:hypothetical protein
MLLHESTFRLGQWEFLSSRRQWDTEEVLSLKYRERMRALASQFLTEPVKELFSEIAWKANEKQKSKKSSDQKRGLCVCDTVRDDQRCERVRMVSFGLYFSPRLRR